MKTLTFLKEMNKTIDGCEFFGQIHFHENFDLFFHSVNDVNRGAREVKSLA